MPTITCDFTRPNELKFNILPAHGGTALLLYIEDSHTTLAVLRDEFRALTPQLQSLFITELMHNALAT